MTKNNETIIGNIIRNLFQIEQANYKMYHSDDIYYRIPRFTFRLMGESKLSYYTRISESIDSFHGRIKWVLYKYSLSRNDNYAIAPYCVFDIDNEYYSRGVLVIEKDLFTVEEYRKICEDAVNDIPNLAEHILKTLSNNF